MIRYRALTTVGRLAIPITRTRPNIKFIDIQRIVLFAGLAIVSYLMVLAWNEDYNQPQQQQIVEQTESTGSNGGTADLRTPEESGAQSSNG